MDLETLFNAPAGSVPSRAPVPEQNAVAPTHALDPVLAFDVAVGLHTTDEICGRHDITADEYKQIGSTQAFLRMVDNYTQALHEHGLSFRTKAAVHAETMLDNVIWKMVQDPTTPSQVKLDAFKAIAKLAGYEPKENRAEAGGTSFRLVINMPDAPGRLIEVDA